MLAALRLVFNATALLALLALAAVLGISALHGQELPWEHLALGRQLADAGMIPARESLLFTAPSSAPFDARAWAWDWTGWQAYRLYGPAALRFADALVWLLSIWALAATAFRRGARPFSTAVLTAWALLAARTDLAPGPDLFAFAAFCTALWVMEGDFWTAFFGRWIWLGPLAVLAVNVSPAAWFLAPLVLVHLLFGANELGLAPPQQPKLAKTIFLALLLVCLCLHPQGISSLTHAPSFLEFWPLLPGVFEARQAALLLMAFCALLLVASSWTKAGRRHLGRDAALALVFGAAALLSRSALPFFLALAAPVSAARFDILADSLPSPLRALRWPAKLAALAVLLAWTASGGLLSLPGAQAQADRPQQTAAFYEQQLFDANILCPPQWTPFLAWKLAPNARFALDARGVADPLRAASLREALAGRGDVEGALAKEGVGLCWLERGSPLALALAGSQSWQPVSFDDASVLYVPNTPANAELIRVRAPRGLRPGDPEQPFDATRLVQAEADLEADLARDPGMGVVYLYMAQLWLARGHAAKARETLEGGIRADPGFAPDYARLAGLRASLNDAADREAARQLYRMALRLKDNPQWRQALAALGPA